MKLRVFQRRIMQWKPKVIQSHLHKTNKNLNSAMTKRTIKKVIISKMKIAKNKKAHPFQMTMPLALEKVDLMELK